MVALIVSCSKDATTDDNAMLKGAVVIGPSFPISDGPDGIPVDMEGDSDDGIQPEIIDGANPGGNRTCEDVGWAFMSDYSWFDLCGDKLDYSDGAFTGTFSDGLNVTVTDGKFVSFEMENCIMIGDNYYKVGAVIVKGSNAANVYFYEDGILSDGGLSAPLNANGKPAGLSNLTFCFVECEIQSDLVVGFKSYMNGGTNWVTTGAFITSYPLTLNASYKLYLDYWGGEQEAIEVGNLTITDLYPTDGYWEITVDNYIMPTMQFTQPFLYVGPAAGFNTDFHNYPYPLPKDPIDPTDTWRYTLNYQLPL